MSRMKRLAGVLAVFAAVVLSGVVHGLWTDRWGTAEGPKAAAARLPAVPLTVGDWDGQEQEMNPRELQIAQAAGALKRTYVNRRNGSVVSLLIVCGRPGPVAVHTPEVCYTGAGFDPVGGAVKQAVSGARPAEFWVRKLRKRDAAVPVNLRIFYGWSASGTWEAADNPRLAFARQPALFKLYVVRELPNADEPVEEDPSLDFLGAVLPQLERSLFPAKPL